MSDARTRGLVIVGLAYVAAAASGVQHGDARWARPHPIWTAFVGRRRGDARDLRVQLRVQQLELLRRLLERGAAADRSLLVGDVAGATDVSAVRRALVFAVIALWGARLTYNWMRGWTGLSHEDWRYVKLRGQSGSLYWLVSLVGLHMMPTLWVFGGLLPVYAAVAGRHRAARPCSTRSLRWSASARSGSRHAPTRSSSISVAPTASRARFSPPDSGRARGIRTTSAR